MADLSSEVDSRPGPALPPGIDHLELVARGGFATVYRGWQQAFNRWVAVKYLTGQVCRFDQEIRAVGSLSEHPHVVPVYEAGEVGGCPYLVMPYLTGGSLQERIAAGPVGPAEIVATGQAVADALAEAHRLGILHRDIKPANILFTGFGVPQLADFGVAGLSDSTMTGGLLAVTVSYAAPEVLSGERASELSDVYSLGATLYAGLRGEAPFGAGDGEPPLAQAMRVINDEPEPLTAFGVAAPVSDVVKRAMAKDPARRYASAAELRDALAQAQTQAPAQGAPPPPAAASRPRRQPAAAAIAAGAAVLALAGAGTGIALSAKGNSHPAGHAAAAARPTTPPTAVASGSAASGVSPPSAGGATSPAAIPAATLADTLRGYYALVDQHRLDQSWQWLSPDFQARIGWAYYQQFWNSISQVQILSVQVTGGVAELTLRYSSVQGGTSTESASLGFAVGAHGHILIDTDQVTRG